MFPLQTDTVGGAVQSFEFLREAITKMTDQYDVDETGGWDATHEAAAAAAAAHAAGELFVFFLDTCVQRLCVKTREDKRCLGLAGKCHWI